MNGAVLLAMVGKLRWTNESTEILTIACKITDEWYKEWQRMTASDNKWQQVVQRMIASGAINDNEWQGVITNDKEPQRMTTVTKNDIEGQWMTASDKTNENEWE